MGTTTRERSVPLRQVVDDQADFFQPDGFTRVAAISVGQLALNLFFGNVLQAWPLISGLGLTDAQLVAGYVYFQEVSGSPGYYSVRFRPNAAGYWRLSLTWGAGTQTVISDFDVTSCPPLVDTGLNASFMKPGCSCC